MIAMKLEKENVRIILGNILDDVECWEVEGKEAEKQLAYGRICQDREATG